MSREDVEGLLKYELMKRGILMPEKPVLETVPDEVCLESGTFYTLQIGGLATGALFNDQKGALEVAKIIVGRACTEYPGSYRNPVTVIDRDEVKVTVIEAVERPAFAFQAAQLRSRGSTIERNEKTLQEYEKATTEANNAIEWVWSDWRDQVARRGAAGRLGKTLEEYLQMTDGDRQLASRFLEKAFSKEEIAAALSFFPGLPYELPPNDSEKASPPNTEQISDF